jgi:hypothetical protein
MPTPTGRAAGEFASSAAFAAQLIKPAAAKTNIHLHRRNITHSFLKLINTNFSFNYVIKQQVCQKEKFVKSRF